MKKHLLAVWKRVVRAWYYQVVTPAEVHFLFPMLGVLDWLTVERPGRLKRKQPVLAGAEQLEKRWLMATLAGITEFAVGNQPWRITVGPDNNLWFTEKSAGKIAKITTGGTLTEYAVSAAPWDITSGPDGNLWFTEKSTPPTPDKVGKSTTSGSITEYNLPGMSTNDPHGIASALGIDGNLWLAEYGADKIAKVTTSGSVTEYALASGSGPEEITAGPDGRLWFTEKGANKIGAIDTAGTITSYALSAGSSPHGIA